MTKLSDAISVLELLSVGVCLYHIHRYFVFLKDNRELKSLFLHENLYKFNRTTKQQDFLNEFYKKYGEITFFYV
jgi:hypothetical protein